MANERARALRKNMSDAEWKLWQSLRRGQIEGYRFRRQHPIGPYTADFVCLEKRLIIEVDGGQHAEEMQIEHDAKRTDWRETRTENEAGTPLASDRVRALGHPMRTPKTHRRLRLGHLR